MMELPELHGTGNQWETECQHWKGCLRTSDEGTARHKKCTHAQEQKHQKARKEQKEQSKAQESTTGDSERWKECAEQRAHHWNVRKDKARTARGRNAQAET